jgi:hypothetical protein
MDEKLFFRRASPCQAWHCSSSQWCITLLFFGDTVVSVGFVDSFGPSLSRSSGKDDATLQMESIHIGLNIKHFGDATQALSLVAIQEKGRTPIACLRAAGHLK